MNANSYYGISKNMFQKEVEAEQLYQSSSYKEGMNRLEYLKEVKGIGLVTGVTGVGKTTLMRGFAESLNKDKYNVIYISLTNSKSFEFLTIICQALRISLGDCYLSNIKRRIQEEIIKQKNEYGKETIIIIDNAEKLKKEILCDFDFLYEFHYDSEDYTSIVLCGEADIIKELKKSTYESLRQRLVFTYHLQGLEREETKEYLKTRFELGGQSKMIYTDNAVNVLHNASHGIIRKLNTLVNLSMIVGYQLKKEQIDEEMVRVAVEESEL